MSVLYILLTQALKTAVLKNNKWWKLNKFGLSYDHQSKFLQIFYLITKVLVHDWNTVVAFYVCYFYCLISLLLQKVLREPHNSAILYKLHGRSCSPRKKISKNILFHFLLEMWAWLNVLFMTQLCELSFEIVTPMTTVITVSPLLTTTNLINSDGTKSFQIFLRSPW